MTSPQPLPFRFIESIMWWTKPILSLLVKHGTCRLTGKWVRHFLFYPKVNIPLLVGKKKNYLSEYTIQLVIWNEKITSHVIPRSRVKVNSTVDAPDIWSIWTVCKRKEISTIKLVKPARDPAEVLTFGVPCNSMTLAFISTMPESRFPSMRAFWIRRSKMLINNSNSLCFDGRVQITSPNLTAMNISLF